MKNSFTLTHGDSGRLSVLIKEVIYSTMGFIRQFTKRSFRQWVEGGDSS